jgi:hypothetical protein
MPNIGAGGGPSLSAAWPNHAADGQTNCQAEFLCPKAVKTACHREQNTLGTTVGVVVLAKGKPNGEYRMKECPS